MRAVDVGVRHDDHPVVAEAGDVEGLAGARAQGRDDGDELVVGNDLVEAGLLDVEHLAPERQDGLELPVAAELGRPAGGIAFHDVDFALLGVALGAVGELAREPRAFQRALAAGELARLAGGDAGLGRQERLFQDLFGDAGVLLEIGRKALVDGRLHDSLHLAVAELGLGLALELRVVHLDRDDRGQALARVVAGERFIELLGKIELLQRVVQGAGEGRFEADEVRAALPGVDVVDEGKDVLVEAVVVLERALHDHVVLLGLHVNGLPVDRVLGLVQVFDEGLEPAVELEVVLLLLRVADVRDVDLDAPVEEGELPEAVREHVEVKIDLLENLRVGLEAHPGALLLGRPQVLDRLLRGAAPVFLVIDFPVPEDFDFEPLREGIDDRHAHAVKPAGDLVARFVELAAGVELGHDHFQGAHFFDRVRVDRDAAAVVEHDDGVVLLERDVDLVAMAGQRLVDRVVHHFVDEVVQAVRAGRPDIHAGTLADMLQSLQYLYVFRRVG